MALARLCHYPGTALPYTLGLIQPSAPGLGLARPPTTTPGPARLQLQHSPPRPHTLAYDVQEMMDGREQEQEQEKEQEQEQGQEQEEEK